MSPFECAIELTDLELNLGEQMFELCVDLEAKSLFTRSTITTEVLFALCGAVNW